MIAARQAQEDAGAQALLDMRTMEEELKRATEVLKEERARRLVSQRSTVTQTDPEAAGPARST